MKSTYKARWGHNRGEGKKGKMHKYGKSALRATRRASALKMAEERAKRTTQEQLALIALRPGESRKEKARLLAKIEQGGKA